jgi:CTP synthase (UTP-ammonia lyase)
LKVLLWFFKFSPFFQLICRSPTQIADSVRDKLSMFSHVPKDQVICLPDVSTLYAVPVFLKELKLDEWFCERLALNDLKVCDFNIDNPIISKYRILAER